VSFIVFFADVFRVSEYTWFLQFQLRNITPPPTCLVQRPLRLYHLVLCKAQSTHALSCPRHSPDMLCLVQGTAQTCFVLSRHSPDMLSCPRVSRDMLCPVQGTCQTCVVLSKAYPRHASVTNGKSDGISRTLVGPLVS